MSEPSLDIYIDFKGWRWKAPFACMRCGVEVDPQQWAFSRSCGSCDVGKSPTARLHAMDVRLFAGPHELIDRDDQFFLAEDRFLDPAEREKFPVLDPPKPPMVTPQGWTRHTLGTFSVPLFPQPQQLTCDQTDAMYRLGRACNCTCLHTVHPVANHFPGCPEFKIAETGTEGVASKQV